MENYLTEAYVEAYFAAVEEGGRKARRETILFVGTQRFGPASADIECIIRATRDQHRLKFLVAGLLDAKSWIELLAR